MSMESNVGHDERRLSPEALQSQQDLHRPGCGDAFAEGAAARRAERARWREIVGLRERGRTRVAVLASARIDRIEPFLGLSLEDEGLEPELWLAPPDSILRQCTAPDSETMAFEPHVLVVWQRLEETWRDLPLPLVEGTEDYCGPLIVLAEEALETARLLQALLVLVLPSIPVVRPLGVGDACTAYGVVATATRAREALRARMAGQRGVLLLDHEETVRALGVETVSGVAEGGEGPYSEAALEHAGRRLGRLVALSQRPAPKVVAVDADNTLWGGVVGEDGPEGVDLGPGGPGAAFRTFQAYLLELRRAGVLLALVSKNDEDDVWRVLERQEMVLRRDHLAAARIGWDRKSKGIQEMADELGLGVESFIVVDDSPAELAELAAALPVTPTIRMPSRPERWLGAVQGSGLLDRLPPTVEDMARARQYQEETVRRREQSRAASPEEYLARLGVEVRVFEPGADELPRLAQMVAKTNQLNMSCRRRSEDELDRICKDASYLVRLAHARDRFGDYGVVGAFILHLGDSRAELDTFLLSCRAMGRGVEQAMAAVMFECCDAVGVGVINAAVEEQPRNEPARRFFAGLGCTVCGRPQPVDRCEWPVYVARI